MTRLAAYGFLPLASISRPSAMISSVTGSSFSKWMDERAAGRRGNYYRRFCQLAVLPIRARTCSGGFGRFSVDAGW
jgi:hypothetical protein